MAVYSFLNDDDFAQIAKIYGFAGIAQATPIAEGVENSNYLLQISKAPSPFRRGVRGEGFNKAILTIFEGRVAAHELPYFLHLKQHLQQKNYHCPTPILTQKGDISFMLHGKSAAIVSFLQGKSVLQPQIQHVEQAGEMLAKLHLAGADFAMHRANSVGLKTWQELRQKIAMQATTAQHLDWLALIDDELSHQANHPFNHLPSGIIHADFFPNNVFFDESGQLCGVIDFYFACNDAFAYDLAIVANAWCCNEKGELLTQYFEALQQNYEKIRSLTTEETQMIPHLLRAAALRFLLTRLHDVLYPSTDALITPHDPEEYVRKLLHFRSKEIT
jgi:homoserine kinase type II